MAKLNGPISFSGSLADLTFYKRIDVDGTIVRSKTSLTKERIHTDPAFENTRRQQTEWDGRSKAAKLLRRLLYSLDNVRIGNWQGPLTGALTPVQHLDSDGLYGQRSILFSRHGRLLEGLCLSRRTPFESLLRNPVEFTLSKENLQAEIMLPALEQGVNLFAPPDQAYFRVAGVLGIVPDLQYTPNGYKPTGDYSQAFPIEASTDWYPVKGGAPATLLQLQLTQPPPDNAFGLLLAVGVLFGSLNKWGSLEAVNLAGSGRILAIR